MATAFLFTTLLHFSLNKVAKLFEKIHQLVCCKQETCDGYLSNNFASMLNLKSKKVYVDKDK